MSALARFPPLFPSAPFPVWVMVWVSGFPAQDLHRYKQERASCLKFRGGEAILSSTAQATHCRPGFWGHQFTHRWVGQAEHLACRKRPPGAFAGVARTHFCPGTLRRAQARGGRARESPCCRRAGPVCRFRGWGGARGAVDDISAASGRVWGGCPGHPTPEKERLREPRLGPFGGVRFSY